MYANRPNIDIQAMMDKASTPGRLRAPTPIRKVPVRMMPNKQNVLNQNNQWMPNNNTRNFDNMMANNDMGKKPLISPVRNPFRTQIQRMQVEDARSPKNMIMGKPQMLLQQQQRLDSLVCANHPNKPAQFNIDIDDQCMSYCGRCAAQLASQGFQVCKIQQQMTVKKTDHRQHAEEPQSRQLPRYPQYEGNPMYQLILEFLTQLSQVQHQHLQNMTKLGMIDNHYNEQIQHTKDFYTELITFIQQMRDDHLSDLIQESRKHSQIADIQHDYLRENVDEINSIRNDIEENLETIIEKVDQDELKNNLNYYKQKMQVYRHKVEEQSEFFQKLINFPPQQYQSKLLRVQDFMMDVWNTNTENQMQNLAPQSEKFAQKIMQAVPNQPRQVTALRQQQDFTNKQQPPTLPNQVQPSKNQNMQHPKKPSPIQTGPQDNQPAFRRLFQQQEQVMAETSPQFKKI